MYIFLYNCLILQFMYFLLLCLCILIVCLMYLHRANWHSLATLTEVYPCFFLSCKANAKAKPPKMGHGPHSSIIFLLFLIVVLFYVVFVLFRSVYCLCVNVYCTTATGCQPNFS